MESSQTRRSRLLGMGISLLGVIIFLLFVPFSVHAEVYETLYPCLVDLPGWKAKEARGMNMEASGMRMVNATRSYDQGDKTITAAIIIGTQASAPPMGSEGFRMETPEGKITIRKIDNFLVQTVYNKSDGGGSMLVFLNRKGTMPAIFSFSFEGLAEEEASILVKAFDWKLMKSKVESMK